MRGGDRLVNECSWMSGICSSFFHSTGKSETFSYRCPSSVFFANRFRSADCQKIQLPPGGSQGGIVRIRPGFYKTVGAYRKTPQSALTGCQLPFQGRFFCCPLWGKCRASGKGGVVGIFEPLPFIERHPLSQPLRAASSPIGEPRGVYLFHPGEDSPG